MVNFIVSIILGIVLLLSLSWCYTEIEDKKKLKENNNTLN